MTRIEDLESSGTQIRLKWRTSRGVIALRPPPGGAARGDERRVLHLLEEELLEVVEAALRERPAARARWAAARRTSRARAC